MVPDLLYRHQTAGVREQKKLSREQRKYNVAGAFAVNEQRLQELKGEIEHIFIVDDVMTTGASISSCVEPLRREWKIPISAVCIARTAKGRRKSEKVKG